MAGFVRGVALDLDGTLTEGHVFSQSALRETDRLRDGGLAAVLVTGRIAGELEAAFPGVCDHFDAVVAENGAVMLVDGEEIGLAEPIEDVLAGELMDLGISFRRGRVLLAADAGDAGVIVSAAGRLGLDCQVVRNRGELMVLPAGVSKGTGLLVALDELGISPHNVVAVGDAENDLALLQAAGVGVAVANAVPSVREHADLVLGERDGEGVAALLTGPIVTGEAAVQPVRRRVAVGRFDDGTAATVPAWPANVLVCGESGAGKSYIAGLLIEQWIIAAYTVLVIDMEGDHVDLERLHKTIVVEGQPSASELLSLLRHQSLSVVLDVSGLESRAKLEYLRTLPPVIEAERAAWGLPHWIVIDEAHATLAEGGIAADVFRPSDRGYCLVTYHPEQLCAEATAAIDVTITARSAYPSISNAPRSGGEATLRETGSPERPFAVVARRTAHVRHRHKYVVVALPEHRWFRFRRPDGHVVQTARNVEEFERILTQADINVIEHHLLRGDFSRWLLGTVQDRDLAAAVGAIERNAIARRAGGLLSARERISHEVARRYALSGSEEHGERAAATRHDGALYKRLQRVGARSQELGAQTRALAAQYRQTQLRLASSTRKHGVSVTNHHEREEPRPAEIQAHGEEPDVKRV